MWIFKKLYLKLVCYRVRINKWDTNTTFRTQKGLYKYLLMPFILRNALTSFMLLLNDHLQSYIDDFIMVYLDDILIYSYNFGKQKEHCALDILQWHQLNLNSKKYAFRISTLLYVRFEVGTEEIKSQKLKLKSLRIGSDL
ncbi:hypothetical protein HPP92_008898 [Vanilla planifolia]|uniref:Reverse transcriptase domain-containing protein n=1 Tax=Vanilla planifolia TaxID=51239 RepID=A0A835V6V7_VANPL|nr:hypothetical protein HPP92_008898 [Vanilla planifolia]